MSKDSKPTMTEEEQAAVLADVAPSIALMFEEEARRVALAQIDDAVERWVREHGLNVLPFPERPTRPPVA